MPKNNEQPKEISNEDLKKVGEWLKSTDLSQERAKVIDPDTEKLINTMSFIDPGQLKHPYTL